MLAVSAWRRLGEAGKRGSALSAWAWRAGRAPGHGELAELVERLVRAERLKAEGAELDHLAELERLVDREELERRGAELERLERAERLDRLPASARTTTPGTLISNEN
jgi:hypothetical protein